MTRTQARKIYEDINALEAGYTADIVDVTAVYHPDYPCGVRVCHVESGNEVGYAGQYDDGLYLLSNLKNRFSAPEEGG